MYFDVLKTSNILLIDDEIEILNCLKRIFNIHGINSVIKCNNPLEAIDILENNTIDLVFFDICMPSINGYELLIKMKEINDNAIYIAMSGNLNLDEKILFQNGVYKLLKKPFNLSKIIDLFYETQMLNLTSA